MKIKILGYDYTVETGSYTEIGASGETLFAESKILIAECTFYIDEHADRAHAGRHMHIDEFVKLVTELNNRHIIVTHTTQRTPMSQIRKILKSQIPPDRLDRIILLMDKNQNKNTA